MRPEKQALCAKSKADKAKRKALQAKSRNDMAKRTDLFVPIETIVYLGNGKFSKQSKESVFATIKSETHVAFNPMRKTKWQAKGEY